MKFNAKKTNFFFSKNEETANLRLMELAKHDKYYEGKKAKLAKKQVRHIDKWKTFEYS